MTPRVFRKSDREHEPSDSLIMSGAESTPAIQVDRPGLSSPFATVMTVFLTIVSGLWLVVAIWFNSDAYPAALTDGWYLLMGTAAMLAAGTLAQLCLVALSWRWRLGLAAWGGAIAWPLALLVLAILVRFDIPFQVRFASGDSDLQEFAMSVLDGSRAPEGDDGGRVGTYPIRRWYTANGCVHLDTTDVFIDNAGFAYCPRAEPQQSSRTTYEHITGPWYRWRWHF